MIRYWVILTDSQARFPREVGVDPFHRTQFSLRRKEERVWRFCVGDVRGSKKRETGPLGDPPQNGP
jgi:hypothetical protein